MATHSSVLAWRIPGTAEPRGLPSMGSHRDGHDWSALAAAAAAESLLIPTLAPSLKIRLPRKYHSPLGSPGRCVHMEWRRKKGIKRKEYEGKGSRRKSICCQRRGTGSQGNLPAYYFVLWETPYCLFPITVFNSLHSQETWSTELACWLVWV